jgi:hypothetical protein
MLKAIFGPLARILVKGFTRIELSGAAVTGYAFVGSVECKYI